MIYVVLIFVSCSTFKHDTVFYDQNVDLNNSKYFDDDKKMTHIKLIQSQIEKLEANNVIYFSLDKYYVMSRFFHILDMHVNFLRNNLSYQITIEGHADERGTPEYNIALGERRANSVKLYFQSKGVLSEQIYTISYGKEKPIALGHDEESYSQNRRVVIKY